MIFAIRGSYLLLNGFFISLLNLYTSDTLCFVFIQYSPQTKMVIIV